MAVAYTSLNGPAGWVTVFSEDGAVVALEWGRPAGSVPWPELDPSLAELRRYFDGEPISFSVPVRPAGGPFRHRSGGGFWPYPGARP